MRDGHRGRVDGCRSFGGGFMIAIVRFDKLRDIACHSEAERGIDVYLLIIFSCVISTQQIDIAFSDNLPMNLGN